MPESGSNERPSLIARLKAAYANFRGQAPTIGSDGEISSSPSGLEQGQGVNKRPDLKSGQSGGGTAPAGQDPIDDTT